MELDGAQEKELRAIIGEFHVTASASWSHGQAEVLRLRTSAHEYYFKKHLRPERFRQELLTYEDLAAVGGLPTPTLVWSDASAGALVITAVTGDWWDEVGWSRPVNTFRFYQLGQALATFHALPLSSLHAGSDLSRSEFDEVVDSAARRATGIATPDEIQSVRAFAAQWPFEQAPRVRCHGDFGPRNWCADSEGRQVWMIDFERSDNGLWVSDLYTLWRFGWLDDPRTAVPFFAGYGRTPTAAEMLALRCLVAVKSLDTIAWSHETGQLSFAGECRATLARAVAG